ncbi:stage III sporulation protein AH [Natronincola peptidivorans]|uniref:Stage III sporulation protein AH n=1 Tax=Natronincola peptidivorans TaxID=426128 RepID=A0A1H9YPE0_9FIRM|nr:SpoIIIAH-like family protein [Natronincola peptidivorans]SES70927.1 stage III sporulation protein AH [Natronincola peptidivorans]
MKFSKIGRKNFVIFSLVVMLGLIGYINYNLNKQSLLQTSSELEQYRMTMLEESGVLLDLLDDENIGDGEETQSIGTDDDTDAGSAEISLEETGIVDSRGNNEVVEIVQETSAQITESITSKESMRSGIYFIESKLERDKKRSEMVSQLNDIINNHLTSDEMRNQAQNIKIDMIASTEKEVLLENMIVAKGFSDAIVYLTDNTINIVVNSENLTEKDVAKIVDVVMRETDIGMRGITIMNKK